MPFTKVFPDKNQVYIEIDKLVPYKNHPLEWFSKGQRFQNIVHEIRGTQIYQPINVRPIPNGKYEILNGHYRVAAAKALGISVIPALIYEELTDEEALSKVSDSNPIGLLLKYGIDIYAEEYKESESYKKIKDDRISAENEFSMALDEYIEHFLLTDFEVHDQHQSIYSFGDPSELNEEECEYDTLAAEIVQIVDSRMNPEIWHKVKTWEKSKKPEDLRKADIEKAKEADRIDIKVDAIIRQLKDYTRQLKKYLNIDLDSFDYSNIQNKRERAKILYFFFMIKKDFSHIDILKLLSKPSMENIDNSFFGWETSNGKYIKEIKHSIEMEISLNLKNNIKGATSLIVNSWGSHIQYMCEEMEQLEDYGYESNSYINILQSAVDAPFTSDQSSKNFISPPSPLEMLYLRLIQYEYLGQMKDLLTIYRLQDNMDYYVSPEYVGEMVKFSTSQIRQDMFDKYFEAENVQLIAPYVYLKPNISKEDRRRIRECKRKVLKLLSFRSLAYPELNVYDELTELLIISCLQSILLDGSKEVFEYTFHRFEGESGQRKGKIYVNAALKNDNHVYDALQVYWIHKVKNHMYANMGKSALRKNLIKIERICVDILVKILSCPTVNEMLCMSAFYEKQITE